MMKDQSPIAVADNRATVNKEDIFTQWLQCPLRTDFKFAGSHVEPPHVLAASLDVNHGPIMALLNRQW
jgi:hypothetical protein